MLLPTVHDRILGLHKEIEEPGMEHHLLTSSTYMPEHLKIWEHSDYAEAAYNYQLHGLNELVPNFLEFLELPPAFVEMLRKSRLAAKKTQADLQEAAMAAAKGKKV